MGKKIVIVGSIPSSIILFRKELVIELIKKGFNVYCFAYGYSDKDKQIVKSWGAIPRDSFLNARGINPIHDIKAIYKFYKDLKDINPDIVLACFVKPVIFASIAAKLCKIKTKIGMIEGLGNIFTEYKEGLNRKKTLLKWIQVLLYKISLPLLDKLILLNEDDKKDLIDKYNIKVKETYILGGIGVDLNVFKYTDLPSSDSGVVFLFMGRLVAAKGIFEFIEGAKRIKENFPETIFKVVGGFDEGNPFSITKESLMQYVERGIIQYDGHIENVVPVIQESHIFVLPSYYREGVPRSIQEAMAIGRAIITTDGPGCNVTVKNNVNGFLIPKWDIDDLVEKMKFFIKNKKEISCMGRESRIMAEEKFDINKVNKKLIQLLCLR